MPVSSSVQIGRVRFKVVGYAIAMAAVTYFDRVCISTLAPDIMRELGLSRMEMSFVFSAFTIAYAAFEIPTAWWGEKIGTRKVLTRIVAWWSTFTIATALSFNYASLLVVRFLFGAGEAGAWPNAAKTFSRWIPAVERGRVQGIFFMGAHLAGGVTPALVVFLAPLLGWRGVFIAFGCLGFVWAVMWYRWFRDDPAEHPQVGADELQWITSGRTEAAAHDSSGWRALFTNPSVIALSLSYFANGYGFYFLITWLPSYLEQERGFTQGSLALFAGLPLLLSVIADLFGGITTDSVTKRYGLRLGRSGVGAVAYALAGIAILAASWILHPVAAAILIAIAAAAQMFTLGAHWAAAIDIGGKRSGVVSASMNTVGQIAGILSPIVLAMLVDRFSNWALPLYVMAAAYFFSAVCWLFVDPHRRLA